MEDAAPDFVVDDKQDRGFVNWFRALNQEQNLVRFFDRKDFYSVHGENAIYIAKTFYKTLAVVKYIGGRETGLPGVTLNRSLYGTVLRALLLEGGEHTVQLFEGSGGHWRKVKEASPGKLAAFDEELFRNSEMSEAPVVMAVALTLVEGVRTLGVAYCDASGRKLGACEFADDEHFCTLESIVCQLGAKEIVFAKEPESTAQLSSITRLKDVASRCNAMASEQPKASFSAKNLEQDLPRLLKSGNIEQHRDILDRPTASTALAAVLAFSEVGADSSNYGKFQLSLYDTGRYMRLDSAAQRALNVLKQRTDANDTFSLYGLMNKGRTAMARRLLGVWLKQPLVSVGDIKTRHDVVEAFVQDPELRERLRDQHLRGLPDVERLSRKLERKKASLADLCQLYRASSKLPLIEQSLRDYAGPHASLLASRYADVLRQSHDEDHLSKFEDLLEAAIDLDRIPDEYLICSSYDPGLKEIGGEKDTMEAKIATIAEDIASDLGLIMDKTIRLEWYRVANTRTRCMRITQTEEKKVRKKLQGGRYTMLETRKDGTKFTSKPLREVAERLQALSRQYDSRQQQLVAEVVGVAQTFCEVWETVAALLAELDLLAGFAELAVNAPVPYTRPQMLQPDAGELVLRGCRHPCVEAQDGVEFIKNDCCMTRGESWFQIITGPNMGGKSTYIRQVGVNVLMAQVGSFVPCDEAQVAVRDCIFARVGAGDCQMRGVSTFMAEMLETAAILKGASSRSLVIIDELGRGTSTFDGFGLAWAISEHLMETIGCPTLFATHFHELTALKGDVGVANKHVETLIDEESGKLTMLYQVSQGACDQSFGIHVAEFAHFPPEVVQLAKERAAELEDFSAELPSSQEAGGASSGQKRKREEEDDRVAEGAAAAREFLAEFARLPMGGEPPPPEVVESATELFKRLEASAKQSPYLAGLLAGV